MTLTQLARRGHPATAAVTNDAKTTALIDASTGASLTYAALWTHIAAAAAGLAAAPTRVRRGDVVAVAGSPGLTGPVLLHAVGVLGAAMCAVDPAAPEAEATRLLAPLRPNVVAGDRVAMGRLRRVAAALGAAAGHPVAVLVIDGDVPPPAPVTASEAVPEAAVEVSLPALIAAAAPTVDVDAVLASPGVTADDVALLAHSSGSGGLPKVIVHTHRTLGAALTCMAAGPARTPAVVAAAARMFHIGGVLPYSMVAPFTRDTGVVLRDPALETVLAAIAAYKVERLTVPPPLLLALATDPSVAAADTQSLAVVHCAGGPSAGATQAAVATRLRVTVGQYYGSTETLAVAMTPPNAMNAYPDGATAGGATPRPGTVGFPAPGVAVRVVDVSPPHNDVAAGTLGQLLIRSPQLMVGIAGDAAATAAAIDADGWWHSGDWGQVEPVTGALRVLGRIDDAIQVGYSLVSAEEVEDVLRAVPGVADAGVVGAPDDIEGQVLHAFLVAAPAAVLAAAAGAGAGGSGGKAAPRAVSTADVLAAVAGVLSPQKCPRGITWVDRLPTTSTGKILRRHLRAQLPS